MNDVKKKEETQKAEDKSREEEQKKSMEEQKKRMEEIQKKQMEEQMRAMEEQMRMKKGQMEMTLKQLDVSKKLVERTIDRIKADRTVVEKVEIIDEKNEFKKTALKAKIAEMDAILEGEKLKLEMIDMNKENVKKQMEDLENMKKNPMAMMPPGGMRMPPGMSR